MCGGNTRTRPNRSAGHRVILPRAAKYPDDPTLLGWTGGMVARRWSEVADNINRFVRGEPLKNVVFTT